MHVKPNRPTPDPERGGYLADEGRVVEPTPYWLRRVADKDVCEVPMAASPPDPALPTTPAEEPAVAGSSVSDPRSTRTSTKGP